MSIGRVIKNKNSRFKTISFEDLPTLRKGDLNSLKEFKVEPYSMHLKEKWIRAKLNVINKQIAHYEQMIREGANKKDFLAKILDLNKKKEKYEYDC